VAAGGFYCPLLRPELFGPAFAGPLFFWIKQPATCGKPPPSGEAKVQTHCLGTPKMSHSDY
jgi:hypothetical protein